MPGQVIVSEIEQMDTAVHDAFKRLTPQLTSSGGAPTYEVLDAIVQSPASRLFVAKDTDTDTIIGTLTLVIVQIPTGIRSHIEDLVVDQNHRGRGVGRLLCERAIQAAQDAGAGNLNLTSKPTRVAANKLYQALGFEPRETNVYRISFQ